MIIIIIQGIELDYNESSLMQLKPNKMKLNKIFKPREGLTNLNANWI